MTLSRRELGAHYTSKRNILRIINPLCMDELRAELAKVKRNKKLLEAFYDKLPTLTFFDPACGYGNFLVIGFRELRQLEMDTIEAMTQRAWPSCSSSTSNSPACCLP